jgi:antitoxin (DNA-binding transcriptional repressor) of toxin-antitoxin stability system
MKNTFLMKTVTAWDLQTRLPTILAWLEAGEEVMVKPKPVQQAESPPAEQKVDWSQSAAFQRDRTGEPVLCRQDLDELYEEMGGRY